MHIQSLSLPLNELLKFVLLLLLGLLLLELLQLLLLLHPPHRNIEAVWNAMQDSLRSHDSCCFTGRAICFVSTVSWISLLLPIEQGEGRRLTVSARVCVRALARSGASKCK